MRYRVGALSLHFGSPSEIRASQQAAKHGVVVMTPGYARLRISPLICCKAPIEGACPKGTMKYKDRVYP